MKTKFFIALTFIESTSSAKKINSFRMRYDTKFSSYRELHMALIQPFKVHRRAADSLEQELQEEVDTFLDGLGNNFDICFKGLDFVSTKRTNLIFLNPTLPLDLVYLQESIYQICSDYVGREDKKPKFEKRMVPIGRFSYFGDFTDGMEQARTEFASSFNLQGRSLVLYEKRGDVWTNRKVLYTFPYTKNTTDKDQWFSGQANSLESII